MRIVSLREAVKLVQNDMISLSILVLFDCKSFFWLCGLLPTAHSSSFYYNTLLTIPAHQL
jgi:hypothetical protein